MTHPFVKHVKHAPFLAALVCLLVQVCGPGLAATPDGATAGVPNLRFVSDPQSPSNGTVELTGLDPNRLDSFMSKGETEEAWASLLSVHTVPDAAPAAVPVLPPVSGSYAAEGSAVRFTPRYPFGEGLTYRVQADLGALGEPTHGSSRGDLQLHFSLP